MTRLLKVISYILTHPLAKRHKFKCLSKFINWQFTQLISSGLKEETFLHSVKLLVKKGDTGVTGNIYTGLQDFDELSFALHFLNPDDIFVDVGANHGFYSLVLSKINKVKSYAFEPVKYSFERLQQNIVLNSLENLVFPSNSAVGSENGKIMITTNLDTINHIIFDNNSISRYSSVELVALDKFFTHIQQPSLLKIDVEGYESEVLKGMQNLISFDSIKSIIIELNGSGTRYGIDDSDVHNTLLQNKFFPYSYDPFYRKLKKLDWYGKTNTIYIRDLPYVEKRINAASRFLVFDEWI